MERTGAIDAFRTTLGLLVAGPLLAVLVVSRALPLTDLAAAGVGWVPTLLAGSLIAVSAIAAVAWLMGGLRSGRVESLLAAGASGALAGGAVAWLSGASLLLPIVLAAAALLAAALVAREQATLRRRTPRLIFAASALAVVGLGVMAELVPGARSLVDEVRGSIAVIGAALAIAAALVSVGRGVGPVATALLPGIAATAVARDASLESVIALGAMLGSQLISIIVAAKPRPVAEPETDRLPDLAAQVTDAVLRFDGRLRLRDWNPTAATLLGLDSASRGTRLEDLLGVALTEMPLPGGQPSSVAGVGGLRITLHRTGDGLTVVIRDPGGSPEAERLGRELRGTIEELLQARRTVELQRQELERASSIDPLTGVSSRAALLERLRVEVAQARRYHHPVAVVLLDIDGFAAVNRNHGTTGGDAALREVALRIRLRVREADELGRVGSDAFLAVLPHTEEAGAAIFADALQHRLGLRPIMVGDEQLALTVSVGVAVMRPGDDLDLDALLTRVNEALASAKGAGGNRIALDRLHGLARLEDHRHDHGPAASDHPSEGGGAV
ncbi:MAG TPA: GGDEF domain-containing protein [Candidatus Limnocylindria bacterium]